MEADEDPPLAIAVNARRPPPPRLPIPSAATEVAVTSATRTEVQGVPRPLRLDDVNSSPHPPHPRAMSESTGVSFDALDEITMDTSAEAMLNFEGVTEEQSAAVSALVTGFATHREPGQTPSSV